MGGLSIHRAALAWFVGLVAVVCLLAACSDSDAGANHTAVSSPAATYSGPGMLYVIEATTQAHVGPLAIGAGNIWEEEYAPAGQPPRQGLTAALFISVATDSSQSRSLRVYPGLDLEVAGHRLQVLLVEPRFVHLAIEGPRCLTSGLARLRERPCTGVRLALQ
jgi:hypothetical protein